MPGAVIFLVALLGAVLLLPTKAVAQPSTLTLKVDLPVVTEGAGPVTVTWQLNVAADRTYGMRFGSGVGSATHGEDYTISGTCDGDVYFGDFGDGVDADLVEGLKQNCVPMPMGQREVMTEIFIADDQEAEGDEEVIIPVSIPALVIGEQSYARGRAGQRRLTGESAQECILDGKACRLDRGRVGTGGYYPMREHGPGVLRRHHW